MTNGYNVYMADTQNILGSMFDYAICDCGRKPDLFFHQFVSSGIADEFERDNPRYTRGMSGVDVAQEVLRRSTGSLTFVQPSAREDRSPEYWAGWVLAYYQHESGLRFADMAANGLKLSKVISMYLLHEADISRFVATANGIIRNNLAGRETNLKRIRLARGYSQAQLAEISDVKVRTIQLYEQRQNDINKAQASTLLRLSRALGCKMEDLMEPYFDISGADD